MPGSAAQVGDAAAAAAAAAAAVAGSGGGAGAAGAPNTVQAPSPRVTPGQGAVAARAGSAPMPPLSSASSPRALWSAVGTPARAAAGGASAGSGAGPGAAVSWEGAGGGGVPEGGPSPGVGPLHEYPLVTPGRPVTPLSPVSPLLAGGAGTGGCLWGMHRRGPGRLGPAVAPGAGALGAVYACAQAAARTLATPPATFTAPLLWSECVGYFVPVSHAGPVTSPGGEGRSGAHGDGGTPAPAPAPVPAPPAVAASPSATASAVEASAVSPGGTAATARAAAAAATAAIVAPKFTDVGYPADDPSAPHVPWTRPVSVWDLFVEPAARIAGDSAGAGPTPAAAGGAAAASAAATAASSAGAGADAVLSVATAAPAPAPAAAPAAAAGAGTGVGEGSAGAVDGEGGFGGALGGGAGRPESYDVGDEVNRVARTGGGAGTAVSSEEVRGPGDRCCVCACPPRPHSRPCRQSAAPFRGSVVRALDPAPPPPAPCGSLPPRAFTVLPAASLWQETDDESYSRRHARMNHILKKRMTHVQLKLQRLATTKHRKPPKHRQEPAGKPRDRDRCGGGCTCVNLIFATLCSGCAPALPLCTPVRAAA
jgi:hypothetical protein